MIKLIIFDLDGVLVDTEQIHRQSLIDAVKTITGRRTSEYEHLLKIDGQTTKQKLNLLKHHLALEDLDIQLIDDQKQQNVIRYLFRGLRRSPGQHEMFTELKEHYILAVASNSRKENVITILNILGITNFFSLILSNNDIINTKPDPEIFITAMATENVSPNETLILEDSEAGKYAAITSGAHVLAIDSLDMVTLTNIQNEIRKINANNRSADGRNGFKV